MKVELDEEEVLEVMSRVVGRMLDTAKLADADKAKVRRWKSAAMRPGSEALRFLTRKMNDDLAQAWERKRRSAVRRPDWR
jgi:hypothetical protein